MDLELYNSYLEIDFRKMKRSMDTVLKAIGPNKGIIPVVKADAYGQGITKIVEFLVKNYGIKTVACAQVFEAARIREAGFTDIDIIVMGAAPAHIMPYAVKHRVQLPVFSRETAKMLSDAAREAGVEMEVQLKIETGMNRIGVKPGADLAALLAYLRELGNLKVAGVFTHFSTATYTEDPFVYEQYDLFCKAVAQLRAEGIEPRYIHCANSGATGWFKDDLCTHVRPGSLYMGHASMDDDTNALGVEGCTSWRAFITHIHDIAPGESCGYCRHFMNETDHPITVATVDVGYADGLYRPVGQKGGPVLVGDTRAYCLATCMDQTMVDVTGLDCKVGDEVTFFGWSRGGAAITLEEYQTVTGQNLSLPLCLLTARVKRVYLED